MYTTTPTLNPSIPFIANDKPTSELVDHLLALTDRRVKVPQESVRGMICSILSLRGVDSFKVLIKDWTSEQKEAWGQVHRHLMGDLLVGEGNKAYEPDRVYRRA